MVSRGLGVCRRVDAIAFECAHRWLRAKPQAHDKSALLQVIHVVFVSDQATTCGNNALAPVLHLPDEVLFHVPKRAFTLMGEYFTDAALFLCFNPLIRIDEGGTREFGKMSSNGGFSDSMNPVRAMFSI